MASQTSVRDRAPEPRAAQAVASNARGLQAALIFACVFVLTVNGHGLLGDPDTQWHIAVGALIWREGQLPWTDPFSHTFGGQPWMAKEWLSQLILFLAKSVAGWAGVAAVTAAVVAGVSALVFLWVAERCRATFALAVTLLAIVLLAPHCVARPHIFALLPLFFWTAGIVQAVDEDRVPSIWLIGFVVLWANLHNTFPLAYPIAAILGLEAVARAPAGRRAEILLRWSAFGTLAIAAGCATPYGLRLLILPFVFAQGNEGVPLITEWQPLDWSLVGVIARAAALLALAGLVAAGRWNAMRIVLVVFLAALMLRHARFTELFAFVTPLAAAVPLARRFAELRPAASGRAVRAILPAALAGVSVLALASMTLRTFAPNQEIAPRQALAAARDAGVSGPVYNSYNLGGFLIAEGIPTFVDGRSDQIFLGGFTGRLGDLVHGTDAPAFMAFIERYGVTWAIVEATAGERRLFEASPGWRRIYQDAYASVFVKELRGTLD